MDSSCDLGMIVDCERENCGLPFVNFAEFANFGVVEEKGSVKRRKRDAEKIDHDHTIVDERL